MTEENKRVLQGKADFVSAIANTIKEPMQLEDLSYQVFEWADDSRLCTFETLYIRYNGGAEATRNVTGDSKITIFNEVGKLLSGGYYEEVDYYHWLANEWTRII